MGRKQPHIQVQTGGKLRAGTNMGVREVTSSGFTGARDRCFPAPLSRPPHSSAFTQPSLGSSVPAPALPSDWGTFRTADPLSLQAGPSALPGTSPNNHLSASAPPGLASWAQLLCASCTQKVPRKCPSELSHSREGLRQGQCLDKGQALPVQA